MATLYQRGKNWIVQYEDRDRVRRTLSLGRVAKKNAESIRHHVDNLVAAHLSATSPPADTSRWLAEASDRLVEKLAKVGLVKARRCGLLGQYLDDDRAKREADPRIKASTIASAAPSYRYLRHYFGENHALREITRGDADRWRVEIAQTRSENTVRKWIANVKRLFNAAMADELIEKNPFDGIPSQPVENRDRDYFVTVAEATKVLAHCPSVDWRLIFGLARYGGLRCPSEVLALRWEDVLWDQHRFLVRSAKTEHHDGHQIRFVPLWPEVRTLLEEAQEYAVPEAVYVVGKTRDTADNLRTQMARIVERAGIKPWPKLFHNLRATRSTEIANEWGESKESKWIGHSRKIASRHYLQITDDDYRRAAQRSRAADALQNRAASWGAESPREPETPRNTASCETTRTGATEKVGVRRFELRTSALSGLRSNQLSYTPNRRDRGAVPRYAAGGMVLGPNRSDEDDFPQASTAF